MREVAVLVEGQTEFAFVTQLLAPYLLEQDTYVRAQIVTTSRAAGGAKRKGGGAWKHWETDLRNLLRSTNLAIVTTMVDFYGYPSDAPGRDCAVPHSPRQCAAARRQAMVEHIGHHRFLPNIVLHEFETWVIGAAVGANRVLGDVSRADKLRALAASVGNDVELLNDSPQTAPSKRIKAVWPDYSKPIDGVAVIRERGLGAVMETCPGMKVWIENLA